MTLRGGCDWRYARHCCGELDRSYHSYWNLSEEDWPNRQCPLIVTDSSCQRALRRSRAINRMYGMQAGKRTMVYFGDSCVLGIDTYSESDGARICRGRIASTSRPGLQAVKHQRGYRTRCGVRVPARELRKRFRGRRANDTIEIWGCFGPG